MASPDRVSFLQQAATGANFIPLWRRWPADLDTPLSTWLKVGHGRPYGLLLESVEGGDQLGRWSFVGSDPLWVLTARGAQASLQHRDGRSETLGGDPFELLRQQLAAYNTVPIPGLPPVGQLFGFWGYELIHWIEATVPVHPTAAADPPDGCWMLCDSLLVFDQVRRQITAVAYANLAGAADAETAYADAEARLTALEERLHQPLPSSVAPLRWHDRNASDLAVSSNTSQPAFEAAVRQARGHIGAGDVFQLVLSQRLEAQVQRDPFELYRSLRMVNPSPYMGFFSFNGWYLIGSSPEVMVKADPQADGRVKASVRPIAGTRRRAASPSDMECVARQLVLTFESCTSGTLGAGSVCEWPVVSVVLSVLTDKFGLHRYAGEGSVLHVGVWRVRS